MVEDNKPKVQQVRERIEDGSILFLYTQPNGYQEFTVKVTDGMREFLIEGGNAQVLDFGSHEILLAEYDPKLNLLTTYPTILLPRSSYFGTKKYRSIQRISVDEAMPIFDDEEDDDGRYHFRQFPAGFSYDPFDGFGLIYMLRFIVEAIEEFDNVDEIRITRGSETSIENRIFFLPRAIYEPIRKTLNRTHKAAVDFANVEKKNFLLSDLVFPLKPIGEQRPIVRRTKGDLHAILDAAINAPGRRSQARSTNQSAAVRVVKSSAKELPAKAQQVYGKPGKGDLTGWYINARDGSVQSVAYRMPEAKKPKLVKDADGVETVVEEGEAPKVRPDVTQKGLDMIGDLRTDALHEALRRAPIEDDTLMALLILAFTGMNVTVASGASDNPYGHAKCGPHAARLIGEDGKLSFDRETLVQAARSVLIEVLSLRRNRSDSGLIARIAGDAIGADQFLPNMATEDFLSCLSRAALEATAETASVPGRIKVKDTRAALVEHFAEGKLVHSAALLAPSTDDVRSWVGRYASVNSGLEDADYVPDTLAYQLAGGDLVDHSADEEEGDEGFREAAE